VTTTKMAKILKMRQTEYPPGDAIHVVARGTLTLGQISKSKGIYSTQKTSIYKDQVSFIGKEWDLVWKLAEQFKVKLRMIDVAYLDGRYKITVERAKKVMVSRQEYNAGFVEGGVFIPLGSFTKTGKMEDGKEIILALDDEVG